LMVKAQVINNLVVFCNDGPFTLILNGFKMNENPQTNVRVESLDLKVYEVKIIFENHKFKDHSTKLTFFRTGKECVFALNKHGRRKHTMDYVSEKEIDGFIPAANPETSPRVISDTQSQIQPQTQVNNTSTNTSTLSNPTNTLTPFQSTLANIALQPTEEGKLNTALHSLENITFSVAEVKEVFALFSSEQSRLAFAKQICTKAKDPSTYTPIIDAFINEAVKQEFKKFLGSKK
jgi:hypothetical protein